jgi:hypothetical protein
MLFVIRARAARTAVVFRRGPSKQVALVRWHLDGDRFDVGQWLKGRIYERRCDLTPDGERLVYFAATWKGLQSWTAVSRPPYLTALALWPKGDAWGGGGLFRDDRTLALNHGPKAPALLEGSLPRKLRVEPFGGRGEDWPIYGMRLERDGWTLVQPGGTHRVGGEYEWELDPPLIYERRGLRMIVRGIGNRNGPWYALDHEVACGPKLPSTSWADWDDNGDLLFARNGKLYRNERELVDLGPLKLEARESPPWARRWTP